jgi:hypothetical protein
MAATTVPEVVSELQSIVANEVDRGSRVALFAALYAEMSQRVARGLAHGEFRDPPRAERLTVTFAARYFDAYARHRRGARPTKPWCVAFDESEAGDLIAVQDLLLGVNAHINFDLAIATAEVGGGDLDGLRPDFDKINDYLRESFDRVQGAIGRYSPLLDVLDRVCGQNDELLGLFVIDKARATAWANAARLSTLDGTMRDGWLILLAAAASRLGYMIAHPRPVVRKAVELVALSEERRVDELCAALAEVQ